MNHGWPCYEGSARQSSYDNLNLGICEGLYAAPAGAVTAPYFSYNHESTVAGETCPIANGSSIAGLAFYTGTGYPTSYRGGLFFADYSRDCIWFMPAGADGRPMATQVAKFIEGAANPVYLTTGPGGDLFYADYDGGTIHRITFASGNQPPTAVASASPTSGRAPLTVQFTGSGSTDPESGPLTYAWDFDGNGTDDVSTANPSFTYTSPGTFLARLRVTDNGGLTDSRTVTISVNNTPPVPTITAPLSTLTWAVNDRIDFSGGASDGEDGTIPDARLSWTLVLHHCPVNPNDCHTHDVQTISGQHMGFFSAPDHEYPSWIEIVLTATDSGGLTGTTSVRLDPKTVTLSFATVPTGLDAVGGRGHVHHPLLTDRDPGLAQHDHGAAPADPRWDDVQLAELVRWRRAVARRAPERVGKLHGDLCGGPIPGRCPRHADEPAQWLAGHHHCGDHERRARNGECGHDERHPQLQARLRVGIHDWRQLRLRVR